MSKILLSIKPYYVQQILERKKLVEYRKRLFKNKDVTSVIIYATAPISQIVAEFKIDGIIEDDPLNLWRQTCEIGGISEEKYFEYFKNSSKAYAIKIGSLTIYSPMRNLSFYKIKKAPQSFIYIKEE